MNTDPTAIPPIPWHQGHDVRGNPTQHCPTCKRPKDLKVDKPGSMGVRVRPMKVNVRVGKRRLRRDKRDVKFY